MESTLRTLSLLVAVTFATSFVVAGDGAGPVGLLLFFGWGYWTPILLVAWTATFLLLASFLFYGRIGRNGVMAGGILASLAWLAFLFRSDSFLSTTIFSAHFLISVVLLFVNLPREAPESLADDQNE